MNVEKTYLQMLIDLKDEDIDLMYLQKLDQKIEEFENKFRDRVFFKKDVYKQKPKYYLQNKNKKSIDDIQESLKNELLKMNNIYKENIYMLGIEKKLLNKEENKHIYNVFHITIYEFQKINLYDEFINESNVFYNSSMRPITYSNLTRELKLLLYDMIDDTFNCSETFSKYETIDGIDVIYHNHYFKHLLTTVYDFFKDLYIYSDGVQALKKMFYQLDPTLKCADYFIIEDVLKAHSKNPKNHDLIKIILKKIIDMDWDISMGVLNETRLNECCFD